MGFLVCSRFTYEIAPVFVLMEQLTLKKMREIVGWPDGEGDGIFSPGERQTNSSVTLSPHANMSDSCNNVILYLIPLDVRCSFHF